MALICWANPCLEAKEGLQTRHGPQSRQTGLLKTVNVPCAMYRRLARKLANILHMHTAYAATLVMG